MRLYILPGMVAVASLWGHAPLWARQPATSDAAVVAHRQAARVVAAFHAALGRGDMAGAASLLADDALIYESGGVERSKAEYTSHHLRVDAAVAKALRRTVERTSGRAVGDLAWVASEARSMGTYKGKPIDSVGTETMILRRDARSWRIAHIHWSAATPKKARTADAKR